MANPYLLEHKEYRRLHDRSYRAQQAGHREACGVLLVDTQRNIRLIFLKNLSNRPYSYEVDCDEIRTIVRNTRTLKKEIVLGSFHSHPVGEANPGKGDVKNAFYNGIEMIYDVCGLDVKLWYRRKIGKRYQLIQLPLKIERSPRRKKM